MIEPQATGHECAALIGVIAPIGAAGSGAVRP